MPGQGQSRASYKMELEQDPYHGSLDGMLSWPFFISFELWKGYSHNVLDHRWLGEGSTATRPCNCKCQWCETFNSVPHVFLWSDTCVLELWSLFGGNNFKHALKYNHHHFIVIFKFTYTHFLAIDDGKIAMIPVDFMSLIFTRLLLMPAQLQMNEVDGWGK